MRIAVLNLTAGGMSGGYKKYLCKIIPLLAVHPEVEAILFVSVSTLNIRGWFDPIPNVEFACCKPLGLISHGIEPELKLRLEKFSPDVIFVPTERLFRFNKTPIVNMIQNMEPLIGFNEGNPVSEKVKNWFRAYYAKKAVKKADRVIAISNFVKDFLIKKWGTPGDKIGVVYHGIDGSANRVVSKPQNIPIDWIKKFIFTAGSIRPARGLEDLLWAVYYLYKTDKELPGLVIAGDVSPDMAVYQNKLKRWAEERGLSDIVCWIGNLGIDEMKWCYNNCGVFVMSSRVESFGQIALEAMSQGCICISADNPCLPEIFKDAAIYYPPKDSQALAKAIKSVFRLDSMQRERVSELARMRSAEFSWDACAERTMVELSRAIKNVKSGGDVY